MGFGYGVHFWLGAETTQDEAGTAAYKTVECDDILRGAAVQHREVEGHESELFLSYFPGNTIELLEGGIESGFNHVEPESYKPRLLWVKGKLNSVRVSQVELSGKSLNEGDVFILDNGLRIYQWNGAKSSAGEKIKAGQIMKAIENERGARPECSVHTQDDDDLAGFWEVLGGECAIASAEEGGSDADAAKEAKDSVKLFQLSDASGTMKFTQVGTSSFGMMKSSLLDSTDVFVLDNGAEVFTWIGKGASKAERSQGMKYAQQYLVDYARPNYLPISRILEGVFAAVLVHLVFLAPWFLLVTPSCLSVVACWYGVLTVLTVDWWWCCFAVDGWWCCS
jgi:gelsolin